MAQNSHFGWVISGPTSTRGALSHSVIALHCSLERELRKFWEVEELPHKNLLSPEEERCEQHFLETHTRDQEGRYIVRLPFKEGPPIEIGESYAIASRMLTTLNRRLNRSPALKREYDEFLSEYERLGHMEKSPTPSALSPTSQIVYIPHHSVIRDSSSTTRLRVVFNASCETTNGTSLNHHLFAGPKLQSELFDVILRWRQFQYVYTADISKMFRQIWVDARDRDYQRILWNPTDSAEKQEYRLSTVSYGTVPAPYLSLRVLQQLVTDEGDSFPLAIPVLKNHLYVDDVLFGAEDIPLLRTTRDQICALLQRGGFKLRKWASNHSDLLADIPSDDYGLACNKTLQPDESLRVLGITWNPALDVFEFQVSLPKQLARTKRAVLSTIAKLFDPLGWVTPVTVAAKIFMQQLWRLKLDWDDTLPSDALTRWSVLSDRLVSLNGLRLPRWTHYGSDAAECELHGFADASEIAYAAAVYIRVESMSGGITTALLAGRSKVARIKLMSIPRLELSAAVLLSRLIESIRSSLNLKNVPFYCWTDSTVVLAWLSQHPSKWKTFVSHRVESIQSRVPYAKWHHISTTDNPADCASRGVVNAELKEHSLWWQGPSWLKLESRNWPMGQALSCAEAQSEAKSVKVHVTQVNESWDLASKYSSWPTLIRVTAYVQRFTKYCRGRTRSLDDSSSNPAALSSDECRQARLFWLRTIQADLFAEEVRILRQRNSLPSKSPILSLNPLIDDDGLIRVGGRLANAQLPFRSKHPILLASHPIVTMIVRNAHFRSLHAGIQLTLATLRQDFWILRARSLVKSVIHRCVPCTRERAEIPVQLMGQLPRPRVSAPARAFLHCGVDYAGPIATRASSGRGITSRKAYIAVFVCMATRAIHLELVGGYSTSAFLDAYSRFCARRGLPTNMYSDNGTTFTGADKELARAYRAALRDPEFLNKTASDQVSWKFIPPHAPHFGGLWEAGVRSLKHHLRRVIGAHTLTFEELYTLLCKIEACLNSRPLGPLSDSLDDYEFLTPGHFLVGSALTDRPEPSVLSIKENRLSRFQLVLQISERFWRIWQADYVNTLQQRAKWRKIQPAVQIGTIVLIRNSTLPPCKWEIGRVTYCHSGPDGLVRVVSVKTATSELRRPIAQLCLLPIDIESHTKDEPNCKS